MAKHHPPTTFDALPPQISLLVDKQDGIGWDAAFTGCWSTGWAQAQAQHYRTIGSKQSGKRWLAALIKKLWQVAWDLWEHRNGILQQAKDGMIAQQLQSSITEEYEQGFQGLPSDLRHLTLKPLEEILKGTLQDQQEWLGRIQAGREFITNQEE